MLVFLLQGCFAKVTKVMEDNLGIIAGISFGIAFFQVSRALSFMDMLRKFFATLVSTVLAIILISHDNT